MSKYYTPVIEEFRFGFRYEGILAYPGNWKKGVISMDTLRGTGIYRDLKDGNIRVKYLDKNDIEDLGFIFIKEFPHVLGETLSGAVTLLFDKPHPTAKNLHTYLEYSFSKYHTIPEIEIYKVDDKSYTAGSVSLTHFELFRGTVKNYNELEILLEQLSIK